MSAGTTNNPIKRPLSFFSPLLLLLILSLCLIGCSDDKGVNKEDAARFIKSAETYSAQGQFRAAILEAKNAIKNDPSDPKSFIVLAKIYNQLGAFNATQTMLEPMAEKMPEVSLVLAEAYVANKKFRSALNILSSYSPNKDDIEASLQKQILMARANIYLGDKTELTKVLVDLERLDTKKIELSLVKAEASFAQGGTTALSEDAMNQLIGASENIKALMTLGDLQLRQNNLAAAEEYFTKALSILPNTDMFTLNKLSVLGQLTETLIRQGKSGEAYRYQKLLAEANPESHQAQEKFNDAMELFRQGKFADAEKTLKELREQFPQDKNTAMLLGLIEYQKGQNKEAIELFDQFIDPETTSTSIIQAAALAKFRSNKMDEAIAMLKKSVESQPNNAEILATYGLALLEKDNTSEEGQKAIEKSLALNPKQQRLRLSLAKRDFAMKNPGLGLGQLQKAYKEQPQDLLIQQTYFKALFQEGKPEVVKSEIADYQKTYPGEARGLFLEGWFAFTQKNYTLAQQSFEKALAKKENKEKNLSYAGLAEVYKVQGQLQKAVNTWQLLLQEDPSQVAAYSDWLQLMQKLNRSKEAVSFLQDLEAKSDAWQPSVVLAQVLVNQNQFADAVKHIDIALERSGKAEQLKKLAANVYNQYASLLFKENKPEESKKMILKALSFAPENMNILASLIQLEIAQKNIPEAQKVLDQFSASTDVAAERDYLQGLIRAAENKPEEALSMFKSSWSKKPMEVVAVAIYSHYQRNNKDDLLFEFANDWSAKLPQSAQSALLMAVDAQNKKDPAEAIKWYEKTLALAPNTPASLNNLAWLYYEQKNPKATEFAEKAYKLAPDNPAIIDTYGWILVETGKVREGYELLERALSLAPKNTEIQQHLAEAKKRLKK
ncbi:MAG TPA: tetratricopeptide repeat protein [Cellvibrio sp.]|nr:tetratricopeptide repeat protein [Cellvibrio sp.]